MVAIFRMPSLSLLRSLLPFTEEPLQAWNENSDILTFLCGLTDPKFAADYHKGQTSYYPEFGVHVFGRSYEQIEDFGAKLSGSAEFASDHYCRCPVFGGFAKAYAAWNGILSEVLSEDRMFSIPDVLESESDLKAIMTNLIDYNYRLAFAALRLFLEDLVKPLAWIDWPDEFNKWFRGEPTKRLVYTGRASSMIELVRSGKITDDIRIRFEELYRDLSGYVHGEETKIIHSGIGRRSWHGHRFNAELVQHRTALPAAAEFRCPNKWQ